MRNGEPIGWREDSGLRGSMYNIIERCTGLFFLMLILAPSIKSSLAA